MAVWVGGLVALLFDCTEAGGQSGAVPVGTGSTDVVGRRRT